MALLVLDAGVLIAHERCDEFAAAWLQRASLQRVDIAVVVTTIAETWRDGARQARLARLLGTCRIIDCDRSLAAAAGALLAATGSANTLDALVVAAGQRYQGVVVTDDVDDMTPLADAARVRVAALRA